MDLKSRFPFALSFPFTLSFLFQPFLTSINPLIYLSTSSPSFKKPLFRLNLERNKEIKEEKREEEGPSVRRGGGEGGEICIEEVYLMT